MFKVVLFLFLFLVYVIYSFAVYTKGTAMSTTVQQPHQAGIVKGKSLFQQYNCIACHQLYGLGGFLGPELTTAYSDPKRGEAYMRVILSNGGPQMPNFHFTKVEVDALISFLRSVDESAITYKQ